MGYRTPNIDRSATMARFLQTFRACPPSQRADSWSIDKLTETFLEKPAAESQ